RADVQAAELPRGDRVRQPSRRPRRGGGPPSRYLHLVPDRNRPLDDALGRRRHRAGSRARPADERARRLTNTASSAERRPVATAPASTAPSPRLEISTRGGYGSQRSSSGRTSPRSSAFAPIPPPSTTSSTSATAAMGAM